MRSVTAIITASTETWLVAVLQAERGPFDQIDKLFGSWPAATDADLVPVARRNKNWIALPKGRFAIFGFFGLRRGYSKRLGGERGNDLPKQILF